MKQIFKREGERICFAAVQALITSLLFEKYFTNIVSLCFGIRNMLFDYLFESIKMFYWVCKEQKSSVIHMGNKPVIMKYHVTITE